MNPARAIVIALAAVVGFSAGALWHRSHTARFDVVTFGPDRSWIVRLDRSTGTVALYDRQRGAWQAVTEPNPFDRFEAEPAKK